MGKEGRKGSLLYEILIVILTVILITTLLYPRYIWKRDEKNKQLGRQRMKDLLQGELLYLNVNGVYTASLDSLIQFLKTDTTITAAKDTLIQTSLDSLVICPVVGDTFKVTVVDTSGFKSIDIECPIDEEVLERLRKEDFLAHIFGGRKIENIGKIEQGEASWEKR